MYSAKQWSRRDFAKAAFALLTGVAAGPDLLAAPQGSPAHGAAAPAAAGVAPLVMKKIPSSGESIPAVGIGTAVRYDLEVNAPERAELKEVLRQFAQLGGRVIDTAPSYGMAESVVGDLVAELGTRNSYFLATKVAAHGKEDGLRQIGESFQRLKTDRIDLIQVHNVMDVDTQLATLRDLKEKGRIRYLGVTTSFASQHAALEAVMKAQKLDFIQVDYALDNRAAGNRILPLAADRGIAVLINLPFGRGRLFRTVQHQKLPDWASQFDCQSWAQFFLKYLVAQPAVTCVIPGTAKVKYVADNLDGARGRLPDTAMRQRMEQFIDGIKA